MDHDGRISHHNLTTISWKDTEMKKLQHFSKISLAVILVLLVSSVFPGGCAACFRRYFRQYACLATNRVLVELGHCNLGDAFTLIVDDGTSIVYVSVPATCKLRADGYHHASFQVVHYTMKPGDIVTVLHG